MMELINQLSEDRVFIAEQYPDTDHFYAAFAGFLQDLNLIDNKEKIKRLFIKRENVQSTATGRGAAAPHIFSDEFDAFTFCVALIRKGMDFKAPDEEKVYLVFLIMSDERDVGLHLKSLAHLARLVKCTDVSAEVRKAENAGDVMRILQRNDQKI